VQLDQAVVYIERVPDTVQKTRVDWGFRFAPMYGENYRYTTALGFLSNQLVNENRFNGFDVPMVYGEIFVPFVADGLLFRFGRYITLPDIEAQLAPNDYLYTRSLTYSVDNYSTIGVNGSLKISRNWCRGPPRNRLLPGVRCRGVRQWHRPPPLVLRRRHRLAFLKGGRATGVRGHRAAGSRPAVRAIRDRPTGFHICWRPSDQAQWSHE
jgi:hypothetical protein